MSTNLDAASALIIDAESATNIVVTADDDSKPTISTLGAAVVGFLQDVRSGHSPATVRTYRFCLSRFVHFLSSTLANHKAEELLVAELRTDWAIAFMRALANGQLPTPPSLARKDDNETTNSTNQGKNSNPLHQDEPPQPTPKSTIATYSAALMRFYKWCSIERLVVIPSDEFERLAIRLRELRGKQHRTIIDKVPADDI